MKRSGLRWAVWVVLAWSVSQPVRAMEDGLYSVSETPTGMPVHALDGRDIYLGAPVPDSIDGAVIQSRSNDNTRYSFEIVRHEPFSVSGQTALVLGKSCLRINGSGGGGGRYTLDTEVSDPDFIAQAAAYFHVVPILRKHPGHQFTASFVTNPAGYTLNEPIKVVLRIANCGTVPFSFMEPTYDMNIGGDFSFTAWGLSGSQWVSVPGKPRPAGVALSMMQGCHTLKPGQIEDIPAYLNEYFDFSRAGSYQLRGSYYLEIVAEGKFTPAWDDFATGDFSIQIK